MAIIEFIKSKKKPDRLYLILMAPILALSILGFISGLINGNYMLATIHGTFEYIKYFLVIFIYAAFFREFSEFKKVFRLVLMTAVFLGAISFIQEIWAVGNLYILKKNVKDIYYFDVAYIINPQIRSGYFENMWRLGILRVPSFMINHNFSGLYILLILVIYTHIIEKVNFAIFVSLFSAILGSVSRVVYTSFILTGGFQVFKGKKWWIISLVPITISLFYLSPLSEYTVLSKSAAKRPPTIFSLEKKSWDGFRDYTREKAIEIWKDHVLFGVGPGMYGGAISLKYKSPVYDKYNFDQLRKQSLEQWQTADQFWPQVLAETGIAGIICFAGIFISLTTTLFALKNKAPSNEIKGLFTGLIMYVVILLIYTFGYDLNVPPVIFTFSAFIGMGLSCERGTALESRC
ncbi:MAG: O-antigen ligase family protein [Nitrospirae bacterium]|nr:O-antigen ligase family protein [Nitrospirota bacterium]